MLLSVRDIYLFAHIFKWCFICWYGDINTRIIYIFYNTEINWRLNDAFDGMYDSTCLQCLTLCLWQQWKMEKKSKKEMKWLEMDFSFFPMRTSRKYTKQDVHQEYANMRFPRVDLLAGLIAFNLLQAADWTMQNTTDKWGDRGQRPKSNNIMLENPIICWNIKRERWMRTNAHTHNDSSCLLTKRTKGIEHSARAFVPFHSRTDV